MIELNHDDLYEHMNELMNEPYDWYAQRKSLINHLPSDFNQPNIIFTTCQCIRRNNKYIYESTHATNIDNLFNIIP